SRADDGRYQSQPLAGLDEFATSRGFQYERFSEVESLNSCPGTIPAAIYPLYDCACAGNVVAPGSPRNHEAGLGAGAFGCVAPAGLGHLQPRETISRLGKTALARVGADRHAEAGPGCQERQK